MSSSAHLRFAGVTLTCIIRYQIPTHLRQHVDFITPGTSLRSFTKRWTDATASSPTAKSSNDSSNGTCLGTPGQRGVSPSSLAQINLATNLSLCNEYVTPACIRVLYQIPSNISTHPDNSMAIFESTGTYIQSDMDTFFKYVATDVPVGTQPKKLMINGAEITTIFNPQQGVVSEEANLDFQIAWSLLYPLNISLLDSQASVAQNSSITESGIEGLEQEVGFALQDAFAAIDGSLCTETSGPQCRGFKPPNVISFSYGYDELALSKRETDRLCNEVLKLSLQGTTQVPQLPLPVPQ